ncbi:MAG: translation initiation factor IF-2 [Prevotellaceae bacterium]|nr:translation initiation factor IF-2 [Prevotellaceae bacterium]
MSIRLNKVTKECNVGLQTAVEFLQKKGFKDVEANPNTKITDEQYQLLLAEFTQDKGLRTQVSQQQQQRQVEKEKEKKQARKSSTTPKGVNKDSRGFQPTVVDKLAGPKVVGNIDLNAPKKPAKPASSTSPTGLQKDSRGQQNGALPEENARLRSKPTEQPETNVGSPSKESATDAGQKNGVLPEDSASLQSKPSVEEAPKDDGVFRLNSSIPVKAPKVIGNIDLSALNQSMRPKKKSSKDRKKQAAGNATATNAGQPSEKKKRMRIGQQRVDVNAVAQQGGGSDPQQRQRGGQQGGGQNRNGKGLQQQSRNSGGKQGKKKTNLVITPEVSEEEVAKQVRETLARLTSKSNKLGKGAKYRKDKREAIRHDREEEELELEAESKVLKLTEFVTANELATMMNVPVTQVIGTCMSIGIMVSINQRMDAETINLVAEEYGYKTEFVSAEVAEAVEEVEDKEEDLVTRAPIVTVMGHVDHGKTSLLDYIRQTNVIAGEAGGITQHIGAYNVRLDDGKHVTFLDTPGHEAFTAMRARGAQVTDVAIIIIAADDGIMPQTKEAINHAMAANVPIVFAINKIDKPGADAEKIKEALANMNFLVEEWGGKYQSQDISAKKGIGVQELLEKVLLEAEMLDLKANPKRKATGTVIESSLDKGRGYVATVLCSNGTLRIGDMMLAGTNYGRVKAMFNERGQRVKEIGPSEVAAILGLDGAPQAGDTFHIMDSEQEAREITSKRVQLAREQGLRTIKRVDLNEIGRRIALGDFKELNIIVKGDVDGSIEALSDALLKLSTEKIQVNVIQKAVGQISENDVNLAAASDAIIVAFQVRPSGAARKLAEKEGVDIRTYSVIYDAINEIKDAMEGMLSPEIKEEVTAQVEVRQVYHISKVGTVAGAYVADGKVSRSNKARVVRDGIVVFSGQINALKRFKDDVKEVGTNFECGISLVNFNDLREGDMIETYQEVEVKAKL